MSDVYYEQETPEALMVELKRMADEMSAAKKAYEKAQQEADDLRKQYDTLARVTVPQYFKTNGISSISTTQGDIVRIVEKSSCSPNKNPTDRNKICDWLTENGGEDLIKTYLSVSADQKQALTLANIPFEEMTDINTNSLKSWLLGQLGKKHSVAQIELEDIPKEIHLWLYEEAEIVLI